MANTEINSVVPLVFVKHSFVEVVCRWQRNRWACLSTTLGAACHELGHAFDLGHTPVGLMARGFDNIYKEFTVFKPASLSMSLSSQNRHNDFIRSIFNGKFDKQQRVRQSNKSRTVFVSDKL